VSSKVNLKLEPLKRLLKDIPSKAALASNREIAKTAKEKILDLVSKGISPIDGKGRFPNYKNTQKYPKRARKNFPSKRNRPVNLTLSGKFLRALKSFPKSLNIITIGFFSQYGEDLELGHREGANSQPQRPIIPQDGESFAKSIQAAILKLYRDSILDYIKRNR
jgi:hypothetical protein